MGSERPDGRNSCRKAGHARKRTGHWVAGRHSCKLWQFDGLRECRTEKLLCQAGGYDKHKMIILRFKTKILNYITLQQCSIAFIYALKLLTMFNYKV